MNSISNLVLTSAIAYAESGLSIIPIKPDLDPMENKILKKPFITWAGYQKRLSTVEEIKSWWQTWPGAMVGIVTGEISGLLVIDCDTQEGYKSIQEILPDSTVVPTSRTPSGGWHLYFLYPKDSKITVGTKLLPGVDFRGEGGYVVAPPSRNGEERSYIWEEGLDLGKVKPPAPPDALVNILKNNSIYRGCRHHGLRDIRKTEGSHNFFTQGRRDNDIYHAANCLIKGGCEISFVQDVIEKLARNSNPPFPEKEIRIKIDSAIKRAESRERNLASEIREWVLTTKGHFLTTEIYRELQITTSREQKTCYMVLSRLCEGPNPLLEKFGDKRGAFRRIEQDVELVNFLTAPTEEFPLVLPLDIHNHCILYPGNIVIVAGSQSAGKTAFLLNIVKLNMGRSKIVYLNSEMGDTEFRKRLELFDDPSLSEWNFKAYHRSSNFSDLISSERKIFIIDFLEVTTDFWKVAQYIQEIHRKLKEGICVIALQKSENKDSGRGGDFSKEKARLYLSLDYIPEQRLNQVKIVDAKAWRTHENPRGKYRRYKLIQGSKYLPMGGWME